MKPENARRRNTVSKARVTTMVAAGAVTAAVVLLLGFYAYAPSAGWGVACLVYVLWVWIDVGRMDGPRTKEHASREDPSKKTSSTLLLAAAVASLAGIVLVLVESQHGSASAKVLAAVVGGLSVVLSWFFVHTLYTLRYAILYYAEADKRAHGKPIDFNQDAPPRYLDFAYLAFTIGMTFQVSDTNIGSQAIRAVLLPHMLLSYLFGSVILAMAVNLVAGIVG